jgi:hypothetical protein
MPETRVINRIAIHATAETALPTLPAKRANIAKSAWTTATYKTLGSVARGGDDADINDESVEMTTERVVEEIFQTRGLQREDIILLKNRIDNFVITCEDASEALTLLASDISITSNKATFAATLTYRTVAIEVNGLFIDYFPKCAIFIENPSAGFGEDGKATLQLVCMPVATTTLPAGWNRQWYQSV